MKKRTCDGCRAYSYNFLTKTAHCDLHYPITTDYNYINWIETTKPQINCPKPKTYKDYSMLRDYYK